MASFRNRLGAICAIIGGLFLVIAGGVGMAPLLEDVNDVVEDKITQDERVANIFKILLYFAALGGISVILGGIFMYLEFKWISKILIILGAGIGIFGLLIGFIMAYLSGDAGAYFDGLTSTIAGVGVLLSILAYYLAK